MQLDIIWTEDLSCQFYLPVNGLQIYVGSPTRRAILRRNFYDKFELVVTGASGIHVIGRIISTDSSCY